mmetsp:Transcript_116827/g.268095  ORF Transcript_116827/g.268095 Transcript_116827/m.268095 type:complete len:192 (-) Transcript_116827:165-740(-)
MVDFRYIPRNISQTEVKDIMSTGKTIDELVSGGVTSHGTLQTETRRRGKYRGATSEDSSSTTDERLSEDIARVSESLASQQDLVEEVEQVASRGMAGLAKAYSLGAARRLSRPRARRNSAALRAHSGARCPARSHVARRLANGVLAPDNCTDVDIHPMYEFNLGWHTCEDALEYCQEGAVELEGEVGQWRW